MRTYLNDIQVSDGKTFEKMLSPNDWFCPFCESMLYREMVTPLGKTSIKCFHCGASATAESVEAAYHVLVQLEVEQTNYQGGDEVDTIDYYDR